MIKCSLLPLFIGFLHDFGSLASRLRGVSASSADLFPESCGSSLSFICVTLPCLRAWWYLYRITFILDKNTDNHRRVLTLLKFSLSCMAGFLTILLQVLWH